jgi:hypothetical protein
MELSLERFLILETNNDSLIDQIEAPDYINGENASVWFNELDLSKYGFIGKHEFFRYFNSLLYLSVKFIIITNLFFYNKHRFC